MYSDMQKKYHQNLVREMTIAIPSCGRWARMRVPNYLPEQIRKHAMIVCNDGEEDKYLQDAEMYGMGLVILPKGVKGIHAVRRWMFDNAKKRKLVMLDDDIEFFVRKSKGSTATAPKLVKAEGDEVVAMFASVSKKLDTHAHVAISAREGNNHGPDGWTYNTRMLRFLAYDVEVVKATVELGRVAVMEDFDISLQLLRAGHPNAVSYHWAQNQPGTQAEGGCSGYRTHQVQHDAAVRLAELHPGFVKLRTKKNKTGGEFGERTEVTIYWKKAFNEGNG